MRPTRVEIDLAAIRHNIRQIKTAVCPGAKFIAVLKADAYGHGVLPVSAAALKAGADCLAVALPEEGAELRYMGINAPIFVLSLILPEQASLIINNNLIAAVSSAEQLAALDAAARNTGGEAQIMIKVDTGMNRIGIAPDKFLAFLSQASSYNHLKIMGVFTHLAVADSPDKTYSLKQLALFQKTITDLSFPYISAANSAATLYYPEAHFNAVRVGLLMYGLPPAPGLIQPVKIRPAMQFKSRIVYIKEVAKGAPISYGSTYSPPENTYIATIPVGYADGYSRLLSNKASVLIGGKRRPVVGTVCMDQFMVDLGSVLDAAVGDEAVLFGKQNNEEITATELAGLIGTISYELLCAVSPRVPRVYINHDDDDSASF